MFLLEGRKHDPQSSGENRHRLAPSGVVRDRGLG
jgi:hypothetical protein